MPFSEDRKRVARLSPRRTRINTNQRQGSSTFFNPFVTFVPFVDQFGSIPWTAEEVWKTLDVVGLLNFWEKKAYIVARPRDLSGLPTGICPLSKIWVSCTESHVL
jgi:hypothetical protein